MRTCLELQHSLILKCNVGPDPNLAIFKIKLLSVWEISKMWLRESCPATETKSLTLLKLNSNHKVAWVKIADT